MLKICSVVILCGALIVPHHFAHAAETPYEETFVISAYYSPLDGQERYVTGSYAGDIRLNGRGTNGADGTQVYPGMIAAPSTIAFGTKMAIPGIGVVGVHDRGGAIKSNDENGTDYSRLDVWMGFGDLGLTRALNWGVRKVTVTVYGIDPNKKEEVYLDGYSDAERFIRNTVFAPQLFTEDLWYGAQGSEISKLQTYLQRLGYYTGDISGIYDDATVDAVFAFQRDNAIIFSYSDMGAGHVGVQTRQALDEAIANMNEEAQKLFSKTFGKGATGDDVKLMQETLKELGYFTQEPNGNYDENTVTAVYQFQKEHDIVQSESQQGAGYFGPHTSALLASKIQTPANQAEKEKAVTEAKGVRMIENYTDLMEKPHLFTQTLSIGDQNSEVTALQEELKRLGYLRIEPTGTYADVTAHAVLKLQEAVGIIKTATDQGAGVVGPSTREYLNRIVAQRITMKGSIALGRAMQVP